MSNFVQNDVNFTIDNYTATQLYNRASTASLNALLAGKGKKVINAVEIDWNNAVIPNGDLVTGSSKTISTTGELLSLINEMQQEIYVLSAAVVALANK